MKKNYTSSVFIFILFFISANSFAQNNSFTPGVNLKPTLSINAKDPNRSMIYARVYGGLGLAAGKVTIGNNTTTTQVPFATTTELVNGSYGTGTFFGLGAGLRIDENMGFSLDVMDFMGTKKYKLTTSNTTFNGKVVTTNVTSLKGISLRPAITLFSHPYKSLTPFGELGMNLGVGNKLYGTFVTTTTAGTSVSETDYEKVATLYFRPGVFAGVGACWNITNMIGIFAEIQGQAASVTPKHDKVTSFKVDGVDKLSSLTVNQSQTDYVNKTSGTPSTDPTKPNQALAQSRSASAFNIMIGICFGFGKPSKTSNPSK